MSDEFATLEIKTTNVLRAIGNDIGALKFYAEQPPFYGNMGNALLSEMERRGGGFIDGFNGYQYTSNFQGIERDFKDYPEPAYASFVLKAGDSSKSIGHFPLSPKRKYVLRFWAKSEGVVETENVDVKINLNFYTDNKTSVKPQGVILEKVKLTTNYTSQSSTTLSIDSASVQALKRVIDKAAGASWATVSFSQIPYISNPYGYTYYDYSEKEVCFFQGNGNVLAANYSNKSTFNVQKSLSLFSSLVLPANTILGVGIQIPSKPIEVINLNDKFNATGKTFSQEWRQYSLVLDSTNIPAGTRYANISFLLQGLDNPDSTFKVKLANLNVYETYPNV